MKKKLMAAVLALILMMATAMQGVFAADRTIASIAGDADPLPEGYSAVATPGTNGSGTNGSILAGKTISDLNDWQIVSGGFVSNRPLLSTKQESEDGLVRLQKNIFPTDTENEFLVYLSVDAKVQEILTKEVLSQVTQGLLSSGLYLAGRSKHYAPSSVTEDNQHVGNGSLATAPPNGNVNAAASTYDPNNEKQLIIWFQYRDYSKSEAESPWVTIAVTYVNMSVPNSAAFLTIPNADYEVGDNPEEDRDHFDWINLGLVNQAGELFWEEGQDAVPLETDENGVHILPVHLTTAAYNKILDTVEEEISEKVTSVVIGGTGTDTGAYIADTMGDYILYKGTASGFANDITVEPTPSGSTGQAVEWHLVAKNDPITSEKVVEILPEVTVPTPTEQDPNATTTTSGTSTTYWNLNVAEVVYKVTLDVTKDLFSSGSVYDVNDSTVLHYSVDGDGEPDRTLTLEENPEVQGTMYNVAFTKKDDSGNQLPGVTFTLVGPASNPDVTSSERTLVSGEDGAVSFESLPWGTYTLKETAPAGYTGIADMTLNIGYTKWPTDVMHNTTSNDVYNINENTEIINTLNKVTVNKSVDTFGDLEASEIDHTIYFALRDKNSGEYLKDGNGNLIYKTITISGGEVSGPVTFEGVPSGEYDVMELKSVDPVQALAANDVISKAQGADLQIYSISAVEGDGTSGNDANLINGVSSATVSFKNVYRHVSEKITYSVNKKWATYSGTDIAAPENASVTFTLYRTAENKPEVIESVGTITLDGVVDTNGEPAAWGALFDELPSQNEAGYTYTYKVRETGCPDGYAPYIGNTPMGADDYQTQSGGSITNRKQTTDVVIKKLVSGHYTNETFMFTASYGDVTAIFQLGADETKTISDVPVGASMTVTEQANENFSTKAKDLEGTVTDGNTCTFSVIETANAVEFTNTRKTGTLTVSKTVVSDLSADKSAEFDFAISLKDTSISGTFGDVDLTSGVGTFKLKDGQSKTISGLPVGVEYVVAETQLPTGIVNTEAAGNEGTISTTASAATFTNTRETGSITVTKTVVSPLEEDQEIDFSFQLQLGDRTINKPYEAAKGTESLTVTFENGVGRFTLKGGESITITGLPTVVAYWVREAAEDGFVQEPMNDLGDAVITGNVSKDGTTAAFTNTAKPGTLTVTKTFSGIIEALIPENLSITVGDRMLTIADADEDSAFPTYTWTLEEMDAGSYEASESNADVDGFDLETDIPDPVTLEKDGEASIEITNEYTHKTISIPVVKVWDDDENADGFRPASVTVWLLANGEKTDLSLTLSDESWESVFEDLNEVDENGEPIEYYVEEEEVEHYTADVVGDVERGFQITNTVEPPETGDHSHIGLWCSILAASLFALLFLAGSRRKRA